MQVVLLTSLDHKHFPGEKEQEVSWKPDLSGSGGGAGLRVLHVGWIAIGGVGGVSRVSGRKS